MYEGLVKRLREAPGDWPDADLHYKAADAIEELSKQVELEHQSGFADGQIAANRKKLRWIPVTETNRPKAYEPVMVVYIGWNDALPHRDCTAFWSEDEEVWRWAETNDKVKVPITHYMPLPPLPELPKETTQKDGGLE